jgi:hypothetical protein
MGRILIGHVEGHGANVISILSYEVFEVARIAGRRHEAIA